MAGRQVPERRPRQGSPRSPRQRPAPPFRAVSPLKASPRGLLPDHLTCIDCSSHSRPSPFKDGTTPEAYVTALYSRKGRESYCEGAIGLVNSAQSSVLKDDAGNPAPFFSVPTSAAPHP